MEEPILQETNQKEVTCSNCSAKLTYLPGTVSLKCEYCGTENEIPIEETIVEEIDFDKFISEQFNNIQKEEVSTVRCNSCGAITTFDPNIVSDFCPFCSSVLTLKNPETISVLRPALLLPFKFDHKKAFDNFQNWIKKLWWAPNDLKKYAVKKEKLKGIYIPYWTYDSQTETKYTGMRGDNYYVQESYTTTENGKTVTKTRTVTKIRWTPASGHVSHFFDDMLVVASNSLPVKYVERLEPWDLTELLNYKETFLSGFKTESYQIDMKDGFVTAKDKMTKIIRTLVNKDIGGDHQRIHTMNTKYDKVTFKHILLPIWVSAYRYKNKVYRFLINGQTGKVQGERPWSWIKITLAIIASLAFIAGLVYLFGDF